MMINTDGSAIMSNASGLPYQAAIPADGATCHGNLCRSVAAVRLIVPRPKVSGHDDDSPLAVWDMRALQDEFPCWNVWSSDAGRLSAACYVTGPDGPRGTTVNAFLVAQLRAQMRAVQARELHHV
jgi:hypothetical protein